MSIRSTKEIKESPLYEQMYRSRLKMSSEKRRITRNKESRYVWEFPYAAEREYAIWIDKEFRENVIRPVSLYIFKNYLTWMYEAKRDSLHVDGIMEALRGIVNAVRRAFSSSGKIENVGYAIEKKNQIQWDRFVKEGTGVDMSIYDPASKKYVQEWIDLNKRYLSSLPDEYVRKVSRIVSQGVEDGESKKLISEKIVDVNRAFRGVGSGSQRRAERIARDQVGKLNSALSRSRMTQAKVSIYKWATAGDERVRGTPWGKYPRSKYSHYIMDQMYKQVDNARKISSNGKDWRNVRGREEPRHAGQAINCRCPMIPSFIQMKTVVDSDIRRSA